MRYEKYKKGVYDWLPEIPAHWQQLFIQQVAHEQKNKNIGMKESLVLSLSYGQIIRKKNVNTGLIAKDLSTYQIVDENNIILRFTDLQNDHKSLRTGLVKERGIITSAYTCIVPTINATYLSYILHYYDTRKIFYGIGGGVRQSIGFDDIRHMSVPVPPLEEQNQIVRVLDWKVSRINKLINIKSREIEALEELKRSTISNYVMGQTAKFTHKKAKTSWVKYIPKHWDEKTLIHFAEEQQIKNIGMIENNLLSLSYGKIVKKDINTTVGLLPTNFEGYQIVFDGNIILRMTDLQNDHKSLRTGLVTHKGIITSAYICLKVRKGMLPEYLQLQLHVADLCKVFYGMGGGVRQSIGFKDIRDLVIVVPPMEEQQDILEKVHTTETRINQAIKKEKALVESLEDLKTRLIADTVTGKIDVRNVTIPDYEPVTEDTADATPDSETDEAEEQE